MDIIFHEKQEGSLCAQHCLNALLQGSYFTPVDLAELAQQMDDEERSRMAECGVDSEEYRRFLEQPSGNYDDSGYFSVQVISAALEVWNLELVPYTSTEPCALQAQKCPADMQAYICNYRDHWFAIRRLGHQWFNLNSLLTGPELISDTYLAMFLAQLQQEGYSIFVVLGALPESEADSLLRLVPAVQTVKPRAVAGGGSERDPELQRALRLSLGAGEAARREEEEGRGPGQEPREDGEEEEEALQRALRLSLQQDDDEESELERAIQLSLECEASAARVDADEVRRKRLAYLQGRSGGSQQSLDLPPAPLAESRVNT
ncbi:ataxin-3-like isoform X2 [Bacillus rossius redtenbacheri]|uniref:ataxin-3-like isoform X2 n=1 Tax=Bacillus rossius redtenbacheri TaxID=93214 RepID=UPI002FDD0C9B